jgi:hypothetical protein
MAVLPPPDLDQARRFLQILDPTACARDILDGLPNGFTFQSFDDVKARKAPSLARVLHGELDELSAELIKLNTARAGIFVCINETDMAGRKVANLTRVRAIWVEDDTGASIPLPLEPHLICETSPGKFHRILLVDGLTSEQHLQVQETLIALYGSDPNVKDLVRVLRVPGFYHCKGEPFRVRLLHESGADPYSAEEVLAAFPPVEVVKPKRTYDYTHDPLFKQDAEDGFRPITLSDPLPDINANNVWRYLPEPGEQSYTEWRDVGMILHHQFEGGDEGLTIFDQWSQNVREYQGYDDVARAWAFFGRRSSGPELTMRSLVMEYNKKNASERKASDLTAAEKGTKLLTDCTEYMDLMRNIAPKLWRLADRNVVLEKDFLNALIARYAELRPGDALSKKDALRAMKMRQEQERANPEVQLDMQNRATPEWAKGWVWISSSETFLNVDTRVELTSSGFSSHFNSYLPTGDNAPTDSARYLRDNNLIPKVMRSAYRPQEETLFVYEGVQYVNTYTPNFRAKIPTVDAINTVAVDRFKRHLELFCGGWNREAQILANYFAVCTADKPRKVRWMPLIIGQFGDGKSLFFNFMQMAMGFSNCRAITCSTIIASATSGQSGWAEGHLFGFIEELKLHGHNRHDVVNSLKPYITNSVVPCKKMYQEVINILNSVNYFATSNYLDAAPIEEGDRRNFVIRSQLDLKALEPDYFDKLFHSIQHDAGSIVAWLRTLPIHADFHPDGVAPMTEAKEAVILMSKDDISDRIKEIIEDDKSPQYSEDVVLFDALQDRLSSSAMGLKGENERKISMALAAMGYEKLGRTRVSGERHCLWGRTKNGIKMTLAEAKEIVERKVRESTTEIAGVA